MVDGYAIIIIPIIGTSRESIEQAAEQAYDELRAWYAKQQVLFTADGGSVFQFSTAATVEDGAIGFVYTFIITVFYCPNIAS